MSRCCPWCKEPISFRHRKEDACRNCGRMLRRDSPEFQQLNRRQIDIIGAQQEKRFRKILFYGTSAVTVIFIVMPLLHISLSPVVIVPLILVVHMLVIRLVLVRNPRKMMGTIRQMFVRWICRLSFVWIGSIGYGFTMVPIFGVIAGAATFVGLTSMIHYYTLWSLHREQAQEPLMMWEKLILIFLVVITVTLLVVLAGIALVLGWTLSQLGSLFSGGE